MALLTLGGAAVGFYFVINKLTKGLGLFGGIGRKFQHEQYEKGVLNVFLDDLVDHLYIGMFLKLVGKWGAFSSPSCTEGIILDKKTFYYVRPSLSLHILLSLLYSNILSIDISLCYTKWYCSLFPLIYRIHFLLDLAS